MEVSANNNNNNNINNNRFSQRKSPEPDKVHKHETQVNAISISMPGEKSRENCGASG